MSGTTHTMKAKDPKQAGSELRGKHKPPTSTTAPTETPHDSTLICSAQVMASPPVPTTQSAPRLAPMSATTTASSALTASALKPLAPQLFLHQVDLHVSLTPESPLFGIGGSPTHMALRQPTSPLALHPLVRKKILRRKVPSHLSTPLPFNLLQLWVHWYSLKPIIGLTVRPGMAPYGCHCSCHSPLSGPAGTPGGIQKTVPQTSSSPFREKL